MLTLLSEIWDSICECLDLGSDINGALSGLMFTLFMRKAHESDSSCDFLQTIDKELRQ